MTGLRQMFYARLPQVKGTAGGVAFALDEVMQASPAYRWTLNHTMRVDDPMSLFRTGMTEAGVPHEYPIVRPGEDHPQQERRRRSDHLRRDLLRSRRTMIVCVAAAHCRAKRSAGSSASRRTASPIVSTFDPALAIKFTIRRTLPSGSPGDGDIFGSQQYGPLLGLEIPVARE